MSSANWVMFPDVDVTDPNIVKLSSSAPASPAAVRLMSPKELTPLTPTVNGLCVIKSTNPPRFEPVTVIPPVLSTKTSPVPVLANDSVSTTVAISVPVTEVVVNVSLLIKPVPVVVKPPPEVISMPTAERVPSIIPTSPPALNIASPDDVISPLVVISPDSALRVKDPFCDQIKSPLVVIPPDAFNVTLSCP